jgi:signal transduction histidine kinase
LKTRFFNSLFWKISAIFLLVLIILSAVYMYISVHTAEMYYQETNQKLDAMIAPRIAADNNCFVNGTPDTAKLKIVFHNVMVINPSLEVYLLDTHGKILTYYAPDKIIKLKYVPLGPVKEFISAEDKPFLLGPDPRNADRKKTFSAAKVFEGDTLRGYIYTILGGEEYDNATQLLFGSYILRLGVGSMAITLIGAAIIGLIALGFIIRNMRKIIFIIREFKNGNLNARIKLKGRGEFNEIAGSFNEMADTIVSNIEEMKTMDNLRRELVANVSHDLRTPLAAVQGYIETILLKSETLSEDDRRNYMHTILSSTERLKKLVEELFELSKLEARETKPKPEAFSIAELAQDIKQKNQILADSKKIDLRLNFTYDMPLVYADIGMMEKVLQNLLDNAFKFTPPEGSVTIRLQNSDDRIVVFVKDSGSGIKKEELNYIFDRYHRATGKSSGEGLGLGLAIVKKILEVHNVNINVESIEGSGTTFSFEIPVFRGKSGKEKEVLIA